MVQINYLKTKIIDCIKNRNHCCPDLMFCNTYLNILLTLISIRQPIFVTS